MTIARDHGGKRKPSWESKISISTGSTRPVGRSDTPSSILSSDSDIRFTRKLGSQYRCGCCIIAGFLCFLLVVAIAVYLAYTFIVLQTSDERVFRVNFRITDGDAYSSALANPATDAFRTSARGYRERINLIFRRSPLRPAFLKTDILALDGNEGQDLIVHFNVHFDARRMPVQVPDLVQVLSHEITQQNPIYLSNLTIPLESLSIKESKVDMSVSNVPTTTQLPTTASHRQTCTSQELSYCSRMGYNFSSYPNLIGHADYAAVLDDVIQFREIVDSECYRHAYEFICYLLQPPCNGTDVKTPCRDFCHDFMKACGSRLSHLVKSSLDCSRFPETSTEASCIQKPGCLADLESSDQNWRVCDGVIDCPDYSDEINCVYCPAGYLHCGSGKACVARHKLCDGDMDCPDESDEKNCLTLEPSILNNPPQSHRLFDTGVVVALENGATHKVCVDNLNTTGDISLEKLAQRVCNGATYAKVKSYQVQEDTDRSNPSAQYVQVDDLEATRPLFLTTSCQKRRILRVDCEDVVCGQQVLRKHHGIQGLPKMAAHGDWPWHVVLLKDGVHLCDGSLISPDWIITSASCFQGQSKAEWVAKIGGVVRVDSSSPWQQERVIVGLVKSPVEGSTLVLLNLNEPIILTDYVRPICLQEKRPENLSMCTTLGWSTSKKHLQRIDLKLSPMGICENISITTINSLCTESPYDSNDCQEEEFAGSPLLCTTGDQKSWNLVGISNWRIGCQQPGIERPRMYDKLSSNIEWIRKTISVSK